MISKEKAAIVARSVSRLLRKAGFKMADTSNRYHWTEGFFVHRIGLSGTVAVGYHDEDKFKPSITNKNEEWPKAVEFLKTKGFELDERGWILEKE